MIDKPQDICYYIFCGSRIVYECGEMSERFKEPVLKTGDSKEPWVRIPLSPPFFPAGVSDTEKYPSGRRGSPAKGVDGVEPCEGSNPSFSANKRRYPKRDAVFYLCPASKEYERSDELDRLFPYPSVSHLLCCCIQIRRSIRARLLKSSENCAIIAYDGIACSFNALFF